MQCAEAKHHRRNHNRNRAHHHLADVFSARALKLAKQHASPEQPDQRVRIPHRKRDRQADIPDRKDRQRIRHGPQRPGQQSPHDQMLLLHQIGKHIARPLQQRRKRPPRRKHARHHAKRNRKRRESRIHQLRRSFRRAQPHARRQSADHAQPMQRQACSLRLLYDTRQLHLSSLISALLSARPPEGRSRQAGQKAAPESGYR